MAEITLYMSDERLDALEAVMEDEGGVTKCLQEYLVDLFTERVPPEQQRKIQSMLEAKELPVNQAWKPERPLQIRTLVHPLQPEDIVFEDSIFPFESKLNFKLAPFVTGLQEALGVQDDALKANGLINAYANFDLKTGKIEEYLRAEITIDNHCSTDEICFPLSAEEQAMIQGKMDEYCRKQLGESLEERAGRCSHRQERPAKKQSQHGRKHPAR